MKYLHIFLLLIISNGAAAQSLSINTDGSSANNSALLDVKSTNKGLLLPRMTKAQKNVIASPATGLLVFQTGPDSIGFHYYNGTQWLWLNPAESNDWKLTGNAGTNSSINFLGTTDDVPLIFRQNNQRVGFFNNTNYFIGRDAAPGITATENIAMGRLALNASVNGSGHVAIGAGALSRDISATVPFLSGGPHANTAVGYFALGSNVNGTANTFVGAQSGINIDDGSFNTAVGARALSNANFIFANNTSSYNAAFGFEALHRVNTADSNCAFGYQALKTNQTGAQNTGVGARVLINNTSGSFNTVLGAEAFTTNTTGSSNTAVGYNANVGFNNLTFATAIGANALIDTSNAISLGARSSPSNSSNVGIGTPKPMRRLHVKTGSSGSNSFQLNTTLLLESNITNQIEFSNTSTSPAGITSSTNLTAVRSRILFQADSSIAFSSGGSSFTMALDNNGDLGVGTTNPSARLDVVGTFKLGTNGTVNSALIQDVVNINVGSVPANGELDVIVPLANVALTAAVSVSPSADLPSGIIIAWARVSSAGNIKIRYRNLTGGAIDPAAINYYIAAIQ